MTIAQVEALQNKIEEKRINVKNKKNNVLKVWWFEIKPLTLHPETKTQCQGNKKVEKKNGNK